MAFRLTSPSFQANEAIARKYTCDGTDVSVPLDWTDPPQGTKSFTLMVEDPDAPSGTWVHWLIYDIPPNVRQLEEGIPAEAVLDDGSKQGVNDFRNIGYGGPCPPRGPAHHYVFKLYALNAMTHLKPAAGREDLLRALSGHVLEQTSLTGLYKR